jgi:hypothetical protein
MLQFVRDVESLYMHLGGKVQIVESCGNAVVLSATLGKGI